MTVHVTKNGVWPPPILTGMVQLVRALLLRLFWLLGHKELRWESPFKNITNQGAQTPSTAVSPTMVCPTAIPPALPTHSAQPSVHVFVVGREEHATTQRLWQQLISWENKGIPIEFQHAQSFWRPPYTFRWVHMSYFAPFVVSVGIP